jgi:hypothetical protein
MGLGSASRNAISAHGPRRDAERPSILHGNRVPFAGFRSPLDIQFGARFRAAGLIMAGKTNLSKISTIKREFMQGIAVTEMIWS